MVNSNYRRFSYGLVKHTTENKNSQTSQEISRSKPVSGIIQTYLEYEKEEDSKK